MSVGTTKKKKFTKFYALCGCILSQVSHSKYLGVTLSEDLQWNQHVSSVTARVSQTLGFLCKNLKGCQASINKELAYFSLVRSKLEYIFQRYLGPSYSERQGTAGQSAAKRIEIHEGQL